MTNRPNLTSLKERLERFERDQLCNFLKRLGGNVMATARELSLPLATLRYKLKKYDIDPNDFR